LGGESYIPISQFYPKPVLKVSPKRVRVYTHYSTCSIHLKNHAMNDKDGVEEMLTGMAERLKAKKKLKKKPEVMTTEEIEDIKNRYDLPNIINNNIFVNFELRD
jgi:stress response protein YsnF